MSPLPRLGGIQPPQYAAPPPNEMLGTPLSRLTFLLNCCWVMPAFYRPYLTVVEEANERWHLEHNKLPDLHKKCEVRTTGAAVMGAWEHGRCRRRGHGLTDRIIARREARALPGGLLLLLGFLNLVYVLFV